MIRRLPRWSRRIAPLLLALGLTLSPVVSQPARAQEDAAAQGEGGESKGRPLDGYLATLCLVMLALFIVGKSARR
jgi:hypothetical protein